MWSSGCWSLKSTHSPLYMTCGVCNRFSDQKSQSHLSVSLPQTTYPIRVFTPFLETGLARKFSQICLKKTPTCLPRDRLVVEPVTHSMIDFRSSPPRTSSHQDFPSPSVFPRTNPMDDPHSQINYRGIEPIFITPPPQSVDPPPLSHLQCVVETYRFF